MREIIEDLPQALMAYYRPYGRPPKAETVAVRERLRQLPHGHALLIRHASPRLQATLRMEGWRQRWLAGYRVRKCHAGVLILPVEGR